MSSGYQNGVGGCGSGLGGGLDGVDFDPNVFGPLLSGGRRGVRMRCDPFFISQL
ncbi:hypothetical protein SLEP1_g34218 [Rubroshorea leprosula]|uniref:Uncharacterized protein n=1 Tax=Rubroshorea leprosula TaxID=152421 RepID=A0AAV5KJ36_9ROSI|nr:hypothetical protein SLEP1_g34218 [Rubroshorea leprosula]